MMLSLIIMNVKVSLVYPTLFLVTAGFSIAPRFRAPTLIWSIQKATTPLLGHLSLSLVPQPIPAQVPIPFPNVEKTKSLNLHPLVPLQNITLGLPW